MEQHPASASAAAPGLGVAGIRAPIAQHAASEHPQPGDLVHVAFSGQPVAVAPRP